MNVPHDPFASYLGDVIASCTQDVSASLLATSLYQRLDKADNVGVVGTHFGQQANAQYRQFVQTHIHGKAINIHGTSMHKIFDRRSQNDGLVQSGYRSDQYCLNVLHSGNKNTNSPDHILQMIFKATANFGTPLSTVQAIAIQNRVQRAMEDKPVDACLTDVSPLYTPAMSEAQREAFFLYWDISGYKNIMRQHGANVAQEFTRNARETLFDTPLKGDIIRSEGDGVWMTFPKTGFSDDDTQILFDHFMQTAQTIGQTYHGLRSNSPYTAIQQSTIKMALTQGVIAVTSQDSRYARCDADSDAFVRGRVIMNEAPRGRDIIIVDPALAPYMMHTPIMDVAAIPCLYPHKGLSL